MINGNTLLYVGVGVAIALLLYVVYRRKAGSSLLRPNRRQRTEGFQDNTAEATIPPTPLPEVIIDKNILCPVLLETLNGQLKQKQTIESLPVDIKDTPEYQQILQMVRLSHKNMVDMQCPDIPSIAGL